MDFDCKTMCVAVAFVISAALLVVTIDAVAGDDGVSYSKQAPNIPHLLYPSLYISLTLPIQYLYNTARRMCGT